MQDIKKLKEFFVRPSVMTRPDVNLPLYFHSTAEVLPTSKDELSKKRGWNNFVEITWFLEGTFEVEIDGEKRTMSANHVMFNLPNEDRIMKLLTATGRYRFLCFDGPLAEAIMLSFRYPRIQESATYPADLFRRLEQIGCSVSPKCQREASALVFEILGRIPVDRKRRSNEPEDIAHDCAAYIKMNVCNPDLDVPTICAQFHVSPATLNRLLHRYLGMSPQRLLLSYRLQYSNSALSSTDLSVSQIAKNAGFASLQAFTRFIKRSMKCTPTEYRQQVNEKKTE